MNIMTHKGTTALETERLILRKFRLSDAAAMYRNWASEDRVTEFLTWPTHPSADVSKAVIENWVNSYEKPYYYQWGIELKETGEVIGSIAVVSITENTRAADIGYCLGTKWWGQGLMPEAAKAVIRYLFEEVGFERIAACHAKDNPKSGRVMQKIGMTYEGTRRMGGCCNKGIVDEIWYSVLKTEYESAKA